MRGLALSGVVFAAGLVSMLVGVALVQQSRSPPAESKGFRTEVLATLDLADEIEGMSGRQLRMRRITVEPGANLQSTTTATDPASSTFRMVPSPNIRKAPRPVSTVRGRRLLWASVPVTGKITAGPTRLS
jgi:hypothetical protein